jgi:hypothetical protein
VLRQQRADFLGRQAAIDALDHPGEVSGLPSVERDGLVATPSSGRLFGASFEKRLEGVAQ